MPPILGFFLRGGAAYFISPIVSPFFLAITRNSPPNVSPPLRVNFEIVAFRKALKLDRVSVTPTSLPNVFEVIFSEILGSLLREATTMSNLEVCWINSGMCLGLFSKSASIVIIIGYWASRIPWSRPLVCPSLALVTATSARRAAMRKVPSVELSSTIIISCGRC